MSENIRYLLVDMAPVTLDLLRLCTHIFSDKDTAHSPLHKKAKGPESLRPQCKKKCGKNVDLRMTERKRGKRKQMVERWIHF